jgi:glycosyltransferase involved in cell wall biosynthesis
VRCIAWNIRNSDLSPERSNAKTLRIVWLLARLSRTIPMRIVTCSESALKAHAALGYRRESFIVIPNGFDGARFMPDPQARKRIRDEIGLDDTTPLVGLFARFDSQKNHRGFASAAGRIHRQRPDVQFLLAGRGVDASNAELQRWLQVEGIGAVTHLLGERSDMPALNAAIDVAALTSFGEAFPNALGEAMACGTPCVTTDAGDASLIVGNTGTVVARGDMPAWADACLRLLNLPRADRAVLGEAARMRIMTMFDLDEIAARYSNLFAELAQSR